MLSLLSSTHLSWFTLNFGTKEQLSLREWTLLFPSEKAHETFLLGEVSLWFQLYDGPQWMGRYCGADIPLPGSTTGSKLQVLFHTDGVGHREKGFQMQWFIHGKPCTHLSCIWQLLFDQELFPFQFYVGNNNIDK